MKGIDRGVADKLRDFENLDLEKRKSLMDRIPNRILVKFYLDFCSDAQIVELVEEWDRFVSDGDEVERDRCRKKLLCMLRGLKRRERLCVVPEEFWNKYML